MVHLIAFSIVLFLVGPLETLYPPGCIEAKAGSDFVLPNYNTVRRNLLIVHMFCFLTGLYGRCVSNAANNINVSIVVQMIEFATFPAYIAVMIECQTCLRTSRGALETDHA